MWWHRYIHINNFKNIRFFPSGVFRVYSGVFFQVGFYVPNPVENSTKPLDCVEYWLWWSWKNIGYQNFLASCYLYYIATRCLRVGLLVCLCVCLRPISSRTAGPIWLNFFLLAPSWSRDGFRPKKFRIRDPFFRIKPDHLEGVVIELRCMNQLL